MSSEPRKISDIILDLEFKINSLFEATNNQNLLLGLIVSKLNSLTTLVESKPNTVQGSKPIAIEAVESKSIKISSEDRLPIEETPTGFRRTSRPETYSGDNQFLPNKEVKFPMQMPKKDPEIVVPIQKNQPITETAISSSNKVISNAIPVVQRVVDKNGKSIFLADIEISDDNDAPIFKSRTSGTGKWSATLAPGSYKVKITKRESLTKEKLESSQNITILGDISPLELQTLIMR
jgi:hypothetical protein